MDTFKSEFTAFLMQITGFTTIDELRTNGYDILLNRLDTIYLLNKEAEAIANGELHAINPDAPAKLSTTAKIVKDQIINGYFSNQVIRQMIGYFDRPDIPESERIPAVPVENRAEAFNNLITRYGFFSDAVTRYITPLGDTPLTDEVLESVRVAIQGDVISFPELFDRVNNEWEEYVINSAADADRAFDFGAEVDRLIAGLSPELQTDIKNYARTYYDKREEFESLTGEAKETAQRELDELTDLIEEKFSHVPGLNELFYYYVESIEVEESYREADEAGRRPPELPDETIHEPDVTRSQNVNSRFLVDPVTGEVIENRGSFEQRVRNTTRVVEGYSWRNEETIVTRLNEEREKIVKKNMPGKVEDLKTQLKDQRKAKPKNKAAIKKTKEQIKTLQAKRKVLEDKYGPNWEEAYKRELEASVLRAQVQTCDRVYGVNEAAQARAERRAAMERGETLPESTKEVSFDELRFVARNFEQRTMEDGSSVLVDRETNRPVLSERTKAIYGFAHNIMEAYGSNSPDAVFNNDVRTYYEYVMRESKKAMLSDGEVTTETLTGIVSSLHVNQFKEAMLGSVEKTTATEAFFAAQTPRTAARTTEETRTV